nr:rabenosyn-5 [Microcebus murinus]
MREAGAMASLDDPGDVREGFLCPLCLKDLQTFHQLHCHYEEEHSGEDRDVRGQIKSLVQKAKKAKNKLLKREADDRAESGSPGYESFSYGGVDPHMWEPQELGAVRSHLSDFKKHRAARIDHYVVEVNKLIIRLEKLTAFDRANMESAKIRALERRVVPWVPDQDVPFCPDCGSKFSVRQRRHHCRLCGSVLCGRCSQGLGLPLANKLTSASREALGAEASPGQSRRGSVGSVGSSASLLEDREEDGLIRTCRHCKDTLLRHQERLDERDRTPEVASLYQFLPSAGETTYSLELANDLRVEVQKMYELIDALSKKILNLDLNREPPPHPNTLRLQRMIRHSATLFVQEKLLGLMSLPTQEQFEELKRKRKEEMERKRAQERQAALDSHPSLDGRHRGPASNGEVASLRAGHARLRKAEGWLPEAGGGGGPDAGEDCDPLLQQIRNITSFIRQARAAGREAELRTLQENLRQLQDEFDQQQTEKALELSRREAEAEDFQREQLQKLREREWQREREAAAAASASSLSLHARTKSLDFREARPFQVEARAASATAGGGLARALDLGASPVPGSLASTSPLSPIQACWGPPALGLQLRPQSGASPPPQDEVASLNPFAEEEAASGLAEEAAAQVPKEYNPFEEEDEEEEEEEEDIGVGNPFVAGRDPPPAPNPFEEEEEEEEGVQGLPASGQSLLPASSNPFFEAGSTAGSNPFEADGDWLDGDSERIEEELLLQQIDNIKAYIFDAKQSGRLDEVEVLTENLRELKRALARQKGGAAE